MSKSVKFLALIAFLLIITGFYVIKQKAPKYIDLIPSPMENILKVQDFGVVELSEPNKTYQWYFKIENSSVVKLHSGYITNSKSKLVGTNITHTWIFTPIKEGDAKITFYYSKDMDIKESENIVEYKIKVRNKITP